MWQFLSSLDPATVLLWLKLLLGAGIPLVGGIIVVWKKNESFEQKLKDLIPMIWNVVQQELRKNDGKLPNGMTPIQYALSLFEKLFKLTDMQKSLLELGLKAYHEAQGAPEPGVASTPAK